MHRRTNPYTFSNAQTLRKNQTDAENKLWGVLRNHGIEGVHFRRQHAIGSFIVDFCAPRAKLIIELDGGQHLEQEKYDAERSAFLTLKGYRVLRLWNDEVLNNMDGVWTSILEALKERDHK